MWKLIVKMARFTDSDMHLQHHAEYRRKHQSQRRRITAAPPTKRACQAARLRPIKISQPLPRHSVPVIRCSRPWLHWSRFVFSVSFQTVPIQAFAKIPHLTTGSIARSATRWYLNYSEANFEVFHPTGATRCTDGGEIWQGGGDQRSPPPCQI